MKTIAALLLAAGLALPAGSVPKDFRMWTSAHLDALAKELAPKVNAQHVATQSLGTFGNHTAMLIYRVGDGEAEYHETQTDIYFVHSGEASVHVGGTVVGGRTVAPHEIRGRSIKGGEIKVLHPGDIIQIPPKTPHQLLVKKGQSVTYFITKIDAR